LGGDGVEVLAAVDRQVGALRGSLDSAVEQYCLPTAASLLFPSRA
jgi:hypothetical protein